MNKVESTNGVFIRLTHERWLHITENHGEMAGYYYEVLEAVYEPEAIYKGSAGELIAVKGIEIEKYIVVVYKELGDKDGFIITAFITRKTKQFERRVKIWPR